MRISDWSSDVCSSDLAGRRIGLRVVEQRQPVFLLRLAGQGQMADGPRVDFFLAIEIADARHEIAERENAADIKIGQPEGLRSEEHTSELQSLMRISYAVFCLKNKKQCMNSTHYR